MNMCEMCNLSKALHDKEELRVSHDGYEECPDWHKASELASLPAAPKPRVRRKGKG